MHPVLKKLGYKGQESVLLLNTPPELAHLKAEFGTPPGETPIGSYSFILVFAPNGTALVHMIQGITQLLAGDGYLWLAYPKKTSKQYKSDLSREVVGACLGDQDFEPVMQVAIDEDWSALRFRHVNKIKTMTRSFAASKEGKRRTGISE